ncbi:MAG: dihydrodipicolinate synthase family protein [Micromonosporaceae bacterium]
MTAHKPWQGIVVAIPTLFREDLSVDLDRVQEHVRWLAEQGCHGVAPCGSLGEYQTLSDSERADVVRAAVEAAPPGFSVVAGVGGYGSHQSRRWAEQAAQAGAHAVLALPPNNYRAEPADVVAHYREVAAVGLPVVTYNNPYDTKVDLTPELLATVAEIDGIVAVKEFSGDVRRLHRIRDLCPHIDVIVGADDVLLELVLCGAKGWIAGFPNALPAVSRRLYDLCASRDVDAALALYAELFPIFTWDTKPVFVQAIKLAMEMAGRYGGPCRPPRGPLPPEQERQVRRDMQRALAAASALEGAPAAASARDGAGASAPDGAAGRSAPDASPAPAGVSAREGGRA